MSKKKMNTDLEKYGLNTIIKWVVTLGAITLVVYALWYFRFLVFCIFLAIILSLVGRPLMEALGKVKIKKWKLNKSLCAGITLSVEAIIIGLVVYLFVPMIIAQGQSFADLDMQQMQEYYKVPVKNLENKLLSYNIIPSGMNLQDFISQKIASLFAGLKLPQIASGILSLAGSIIMGVFITAFITFFFLKDAHILTRFIDNITPDKYLKEVHNIINNSRKLISRYFLGVFCEIMLMIILLSIGFSIAKMPSAVLCACVCGCMVILPYIGVVIGGGIGFMIVLTGTLAQNPHADVFALTITYILIFAASKLVDDFLLQPMIYSKSVKAHPLEVFLIIIMAGEIGGVLGMVLAIPVYTFLRIIAKEFFSNWKFIKAMTKEID